MPSLTTIRQAQRLLTAEVCSSRSAASAFFVAATGAVRVRIADQHHRAAAGQRRQQRGHPPAAETLLSRLQDVRSALDRAVAELERAGAHR